MNRFVIRRTLLAVVAATATLSAFPAFASKDKPVIGFSMDDLRVERWTRDREYFLAAAKSLGAEVNVQSADGDAQKQVSQIENLISKKVDAIVIVPKDGRVLTNVIAEAKKAGIKVIAYDRMIVGDIDAYISFDNYRVGVMQGEAILKAVPKGSYYVLAGDPGDNNAKLFTEGAMKVLDPAVKKGDIKILGKQDVKDWLPENALKIAENVLTQFQNKIDAFVAPNDGTAGGIIQALAAQKLAGKVLVTGQDAELAAVKRIVDGTQLMTIYKPLRGVAEEAAKLTVAMIKGQKVAFNAPKYNNGTKMVDQMLLAPTTITKANVDVLVKDGFYTKEQLGLK